MSSSNYGEISIVCMTAFMFSIAFKRIQNGKRRRAGSNQYGNDPSSTMRVNTHKTITETLGDLFGNNVDAEIDNVEITAKGSGNSIERNKQQKLKDTAPSPADNKRSSLAEIISKQNAEKAAAEKDAAAAAEKATAMEADAAAKKADAEKADDLRAAAAASAIKADDLRAAAAASAIKAADMKAAIKADAVVEKAAAIKADAVVEKAAAIKADAMEADDVAAAGADASGKPNTVPTDSGGRKNKSKNRNRRSVKQTRRR